MVDQKIMEIGEEMLKTLGNLNGMLNEAVSQLYQVEILAQGSNKSGKTICSKKKWQ